MIDSIRSGRLAAAFTRLDRFSDPEMLRPYLAVHEIERSRTMPPPRALAFAAGRYLVRAVLGRLLRVRSCDVPLHAPPGSKPRLRVTDPTLALSISHSRTAVLAAFHSGGEVGADIEDVAAPPTHLAGRFFPVSEAAALAEGRADFWQLWTAKEACGKAAGLGLADAMARPTSPGDGSILWSAVDVGPGHVGAVALAPVCVAPATLDVAVNVLDLGACLGAPVLDHPF